MIGNKKIKEKLDTISRNVDFANSRLLFLEGIVRTYMKVDQMPISQGWKRLTHQAGGKLLQLVDLICREHNIPYWLYAGSLIGAKLYKHSIPWDDDWDIGMLRKDYEKFRELCLILFENSDVISPTFLGYSIQFRHKKFPLFGDVFPFDSYYEDINTPEQMEYLKQKLKLVKEKTPFSLWHCEERLRNRSMKIVSESDYLKTRENYNTIVMENKEPSPRGVLLENPVVSTVTLNNIVVSMTTLDNIYKYDWIFPLKECEYEGITVFCPNNSEALLAQKFGDILDLPPNLTNHRTMVTAADIPEIKKFIEEDMRELYEKIKKAANYKIETSKFFK